MTHPTQIYKEKGTLTTPKTSIKYLLKCQDKINATHTTEGWIEILDNIEIKDTNMVLL
jgi:hypothetical protein